MWASNKQTRNLNKISEKHKEKKKERGEHKQDIHIKRNINKPVKPPFPFEK